MVTILQTNQYRDLSSFSDVGPFEPLSTDTHGQVIREVAPARITLPREEHPNEPLCLQVALICDLRRTVPVQPNPEETGYPRRWDGNLPLDEQAWWDEGWQATAAPAKEKVAKLIPIVTTEAMPTIDVVELARTSIHRWFNGRVLNRDLAVLCERVNQAPPRLPDGRRLFFTMQPTHCILAAQRRVKIP